MAIGIDHQSVEQGSRFHRIQHVVFAFEEEGGKLEKKGIVSIYLLWEDEGRERGAVDPFRLPAPIRSQQQAPFYSNLATSSSLSSAEILRVETRGSGLFRRQNGTSQPENKAL